VKPENIPFSSVWGAQSALPANGFAAWLSVDERFRSFGAEREGIQIHKVTIEPVA
jgi:hypothetical protein